MKPIRIQLSRKKGWKMPENTVKVDHTTAWRNPFKVGGKISECPYFTTMRAELTAHEMYKDEITPEVSVRLFRADLERYPGKITFAKQYLANKNLACWCKIGEPCHAYVWLEKVNE